jgi:eukaryotic-like serine/threonine-protein kinase
MPVQLLDEEALFHAARRITDPAARELFLNQACGDDAALAERVRTLLALHEQEPESFAAPKATVAFEPAAEGPGSRVGPYLLREKIGEGGFGLVFVAEQQEPVKRKVALKVIKPGMDTKQVIARFEAERQALALMDHPNIAKVLDAGATDSGRPYFVMELVRGIPITDYCDQHQLSPRERLDLFVTVCHAIQHAHQKGIIHRDIKPSNVLVTSHDGRPVAKVIDFGVAKAIHQQLTERTIYTQFAQMIGTPLYMSPEQAEMSGLDIDTRSDVYSLGVLLYELLTGTTPLEKKRFAKAAYDEIRRVIREEEPPKPSQRLSTSESLPSIAASRHTEPTKLSNLIRGDLDWITMKALEKDRTRRYETANGLARDIQRHLADEIVEARPPSTGYRLRKFAKKNRAALTTAATIALLLVFGVVGTTFGVIRANRAAEAARRAMMEAEVQKEKALRSAEQEAEQRVKAEEAKKEAQAKEVEANAVLQFFEQRVFAAGRPKGQQGGLGSNVSLREAIESSLPTLDRAFAKQPLVEARLRQRLGGTFFYLGETKRAAEQGERSCALFTRHLGADHPDTLESVHGLALCFYALGRHEEALKLREKTLAIRKRVLPPDDYRTLQNMGAVADSYAALNRHEEAFKLREETLTAMERTLPAVHLERLAAMSNLANSYATLNRHAEALRLGEETLAIQKRALPPDHPLTLSTMHNLANRYFELNRRPEALKLREETLAARKRVLPPDHPDTLQSMHGLANSFADLNRREEALKLREEILAVRRRVLPPDHPQTLQSMHNLAIGYASLNRHEEALKLREETLAARKRVLAKDHPDTLDSMWSVAGSLVKLDRGAEAIPLIDECVVKAAGKAVDPRLIPRLMSLRLQHFQKADDPVGCRATAVMWENLNRGDAVSLYDAACYRAVAATVQIKAGGADAARLAKEDADKAMTWLHKAVAAGYKDAAHMKKDADLDFLRDREDFKKLLAELEAKATPKTR